MLGLGLGIWLPAMGGGFSPASLFAASEPGVWLDPSDLSTLFQDTAGTTPVTAAGQPVGRILDKSGRGNHATQTTVENQMAFEQTGRYLYLTGDTVTDTFSVTLPDMGADATVAYTTEAGVTILTGQTIGAGIYTLPLFYQLYGFIAIDRSLTAMETAQLTAWLEQRAPDFSKIRTRMDFWRVDFVGLGDSNQIFGGHGWDHGFQFALSQIAPMWATGLVSQNENAGSGSGQGYLYNRSGAIIGATSGAPAGLDTFLNKGTGGLSPAFYTYVADGGSVANNAASGLILQANCPIDNGAALAFDTHYGTFTTGGGQFRASVRLEQSPFTLLVANAARSTNTGAFGMAVETVTLPADATRSGRAVGGKPIQVGVTGITGPYFNTYYRFRNPSRTAGWSYGTLDFRGGQSTRTVANDLLQASDATLVHYFGILRDNQEQNVKTIVICVNEGINDRNETLASLGPSAVADGDSPEAFVDNFLAIKNRIEALWTAQGWPLDELFWAVVPSHPISAPDDAELISYREAISDYLMTIPRAEFVDLAALTNEAEMLANGWYASAGADRNHLTQAGYEQLSTRIIGALS